MTALTADRQGSIEYWKYYQFTLTSGTKAYKNGACALVLGTGKVKPAAALSTHLPIGNFDETVDASSADKPVRVRFPNEMALRWYVNSGVSALASTDIGGLCYVEDDQTAAKLPAGGPMLGRVWAIDSTRGVLVQPLMPARAASLKSAALSWTANAITIGDYPEDGTVYDVPTTAAASAITLPTNATEGTKLYFCADGTKNGHTVQYKDQTGPTNITTALTASKRHLTIAVFEASVWVANGYVSP